MLAQWNPDVERRSAEGDYNSEGLLEIIFYEWAHTKIHHDQVADYSMPSVAEKVVRIIVSYSGYGKRDVWKKC